MLLTDFLFSFFSQTDCGYVRPRHKTVGHFKVSFRYKIGLQCYWSNGAVQMFLQMSTYK